MHELWRIAGLAAYPSWVPTLRHLHLSLSESPHPAVCVFTDYNEEAQYRAREMLGSLVEGYGMQTPEMAVNPFRQPLPMRPTDNRLPTMSSAVLLMWNYSKT